MTSITNSSYGTKLSNRNNIDWVDGRFERAVDILQSLPRSGPIQTSYDDKLLLYSVYKQATEGNIQTSRPGLLDVMGRAKWDAWNKRKGLSEDGAKRLYVDSLLKILRTFMDRPQAVAHIKDLEWFTLDAGQITGSQTVDDDSDISSFEGDPLPSLSNINQHPQVRPLALPFQAPATNSRRSYRSGAPSPSAPSLPGYGPPRTGADSVIGEADYRSDSENEREQQHSSDRGGIHRARSSLDSRRYTSSMNHTAQRHGPSLHPQNTQSTYLQQSQQPLFTQTSKSHHSLTSQSHIPPPSFQGYTPPLSASAGPSSQLALLYSNDFRTSVAPSQPPPTKLLSIHDVSTTPVRYQSAVEAPILDRLQLSLINLQGRLNELESNKLTNPISTLQSATTLIKLAYIQILLTLRLRSITPQLSDGNRVRVVELVLVLLKGVLKGGGRILGDLAAGIIMLSFLARLNQGGVSNDVGFVREIWQNLKALYLISAGTRRLK